MNWVSLDELTNRVIDILTSYIPFEDKAECEISRTIVSTDDYKQGKKVYEVVQKRFKLMNDGGGTLIVLKIFMAYPQRFRGLLQDTLKDIFKEYPYFANKLRSIITFFIERDQELQAYDEFLSRTFPWVWTFSALEGSGKSHLLKQMEERTPDIPVVGLDFAAEQPSSAGDRKPIDILFYLEKFADQVGNKCDSDEYKEFIKIHKEAREDIKNIFKKVMEFIRAGANPKDIEGFRDEQRKDAWEKATDAFHELMKTFKPEHLIIHLDACEWLMESTNLEARQWLINNILNKLYNSMHGNKKLHVVMMSSVKIDLSPLEGQKHTPLQALNEQAVQEYLQKIGVDNSVLREQFYKMTGGHAICVSILSKFWDTWKNENKVPSTADDLLSFEREFYEEVNTGFIDGYVLNKFDKSPLQNLTKFGIIFREFDLQKFTAVFPVEEEVFRQLTRRSYIKRKNGYSNIYEIDELFRAVLGQFVRRNLPRSWQKYHKLARGYLLNKYCDDPTILSNADRELILNHPMEEVGSVARHHFFQKVIVEHMSRSSPPDSPEWYYHSFAQLLGDPTEKDAILYWIGNLVNLDKLDKQKVDETRQFVNAACDKTIMFTEVASRAQKYRQDVLKEG